MAFPVSINMLYLYKAARFYQMLAKIVRMNVLTVLSQHGVPKYSFPAIWACTLLTATKTDPPHLYLQTKSGHNIPNIRCVKLVCASGISA